MAMSPMQIIGDLVFQKGYDMVVDQTHIGDTPAGYIYFGIALSGVKPTAGQWAICRCQVTNSNKLNFFRWANGKGYRFDQIWNTSGFDDVYNGTASF